MDCPQCHMVNVPEGARFCPECGAALGQGPASRRFCAACGNALGPQARFCPACGTAAGATAPPITAPGGDAALLTTSGKLVRAPDVERLRRLAPRQFVERLLSTRGKMGRERRLVTILFSDVKGSTQMAEHMDPEEVMEIMDGVFDVLIEPVYRHEGTLARLMGDAILAFFGAPVGHEDDPQRAVLAALDILHGVQGYAARLAQERGVEDFNVRIGIHTGLVVVGEIGSDLRVEYTAMGDAINLAARLEQNAPVGGILISHDTYQHVRGLFEVGAQPPLSVKGRSEPVEVFTVLRALPRSFYAGGRGVEGIAAPLIGRERELAFLQQVCRVYIDPKGYGSDHRLKPLGPGSIHFVTVYGEAGVGKSRLLFEFENWLEAQGSAAVILRGRASAIEQHTPYGVLRDVFRQRFEIYEDDSAAQVRGKFEAGMGDWLPLERVHLLGHVLGLGFGDTPAVQAQAGGRNLAAPALADLSAWLRRMATQAPLIVLFEDLHWMDDATLDFIESLAGELRGERLLMIGLARGSFAERRPQWGGAPAFTRLDLAPLSERYSRALVGAIFQTDQAGEGAAGLEALSRLIIERAEGNPFYLEELATMLIGDGVIVRTAEGWRVEAQRLEAARVPPTLVGVLQARLDALPEAERQALQRASVVGRRFWDALAAALGDEDVESRADSIRPYNCSVGADGVDPHDIHPVGADGVDPHDIHPVGADGVDPHDIHPVGADGVDPHDIHPVGADGVRPHDIHPIGADGVDPHDIHPVGADGVDPHDIHPVGADGVRPHDIHPVGADGVRPHDVDAAVFESLRRRQLVFAQGRSAFAGAHEYLFKHAILHDVTYETVLLKLRRLYHRRAAEWLEAHCRERLDEYATLIAGHYERAHENEQAINWLRKAGDSAMQLAAFSACLDAYRRAVELAAPEHPQRAYLLGRLAASWMRLGNFAQASRFFAQAIDLAQAREDWVTLAYARRQMIFINQTRGESELARQMAEGALEAARRSGDRQSIAHCVMMMSDFAPDPPAALACLDEALASFRQAGDRPGEANALMNLGIFFDQQRQYTEGRRYHQASLELYRQINNRWGVANCLGNLAEGYMEQEKDYQTAIEMIQESVRIEREIGDRESLCIGLLNLGAAYAHLGQHERAVGAWRESLVEAQAVGARYILLTVLANLAEAYACQGEARRAARLMGAVADHPAWDKDWREVTADGMALLRAALSEAELEAAMAEGKAAGMEAMVEVEIRLNV